MPSSQHQTLLYLDISESSKAFASGLAVWGVFLKSLDCWDLGFEFRCGHGCSSVVFVVFCSGSCFCDELITSSGESNLMCLCLIVCGIEI